MSAWRNTCSLLQSFSCHLKTIPLTPNKFTPPHQHLHSPAKLLSHLAVDLDDSGQGLEADGMWTFLERMNWADPTLVFSSLVPSAGERQGLGREGAASGAAGIFPREG